jgi:hypothetical protein
VQTDRPDEAFLQRLTVIEMPRRFFVSQEALDKEL